MQLPTIRMIVPLTACLFLLTNPVGARNSGVRVTNAVPTSEDSVTLNANRIWATLNNRGSLDSYGPGGAYWLYRDPQYPYNNVILFDAGIGIIGRVEGQLRIGLTQWGSSYAPGPIVDGKPALWVRPQDAARYRPYKISKGDTTSGNPDYAEWPHDLGAPLDDQGKPKLYADQTIWMVYNDADTSVRPAEWNPSASFPHAALEIQQLAYAHQSTLCDSAALLANVVFFEWTIINKEPATIDSAYAILWTDIDFGSTLSNIPAIDTLRQLPYCWDGEFPWSGAPAPLAVGYLPLRGPSVPSSGDTAMFRGTRRPGYRNLSISSFWPVLDDAGPDSGNFFFTARTIGHLWSIARGFDKDDLPLVDPTNGQATKFPLAGDPVTGTGWIWDGGIGGGSGFYLFFGPFSMAPNDTQWLQAALVPALGRDHFDAIQILRQHADELRHMPYDSLLSSNFEHIACQVPFVPTAIQLFQNYPNPFNTATEIIYDVDRPTAVRLTVYDLTGRKVAVLVDASKPQGRYRVEFNGKGLASGVYFYRLQTDNTSLTKKFILLR